MEWDIKNLDCSKMLIDPLNPKLVGFLESNIPRIKSVKIDYKAKVFTKSQVYRWVLLLYDKNSEIQAMQNLSWFGKKYEAAAYAGFKLGKDNSGKLKFIKEVDDAVMGKNDGVNDIICEFLAWSRNQQWRYLVFLEEAMLSLSRDALGRKITKANSSQEYMKLYRDSVSTANELAHVFEETEDFYNKFYYKIEEARSAVSPEDYARNISVGDDLASDCPYGVDFGRKSVSDRITFIGEDEEKINS